MKFEGKAYILHSRPFKDSSCICECFTTGQGIISLLAKGAKRPRSRMMNLVQPFILVDIQWMGRQELKTLTAIESSCLNPVLNGKKILLGLYVNELMLRLLHPMDPHPKLFQEYNDTLHALSIADEDIKLQGLLRQFELKLLAELGYGLDLSSIEPDLLYTYDSTHGMVEVKEVSNETKCVSGRSIIALRENKCTEDIHYRESKKLMRHVLGHYLGQKPLQSRKLYA